MKIFTLFWVVVFTVILSTSTAKSDVTGSLTGHFNITENWYGDIIAFIGLAVCFVDGVSVDPQTYWEIKKNGSVIDTSILDQYDEWWYWGGDYYATGRSQYGQDCNNNPLWQASGSWSETL